MWGGLTFANMKTNLKAEQGPLTANSDDRVDMRQINLGGNYHFTPEGRFDFYAGVLVSWVGYSSSTFNFSEVDNLDYQVKYDDELSWGLNGGVDIPFGPEQFVVRLVGGEVSCSWRWREIPTSNISQSIRCRVTSASATAGGSAKRPTSRGDGPRGLRRPVPPSPPSWDLGPGPGNETVVGGSDVGPPGGYPPFHSNQPPGGPHAEPSVLVLSLSVVQDRKTPRPQDPVGARTNLHLKMVVSAGPLGP